MWLSVDPLAEKFPRWNPYHYTMNNPINLIDPDGREVVVPQEKDRETMMGYLDKIYGKDKFKFNSDGYLSFVGDKKGMSRDQKKSLSFLNSAIGAEYDISVKLSNFSEEESRMLDSKQNVLGSEGGALSLISTDSNGKVVGATVLMDPNKLTEVPLYNASFVYKNGDGTIVTGASSCPPGVNCAESFSTILNNGRAVKAPKSPEATIIQEIAHPIYENGNQRDVLKEENLVRDILRIGRRSAADPAH